MTEPLPLAELILTLTQLKDARNKLVQISLLETGHIIMGLRRAIQKGDDRDGSFATLLKRLAPHTPELQPAAKIDPPADMPVKVKLTAQEMERAVVEQVIDDLLAANFEITVDDGEEDVLEKSWDKRLILDAMFTTDEDWLKAYLPGQAYWTGWVRLIYGNDGHDVVADHTLNLTDTLATSSKLADDLAAQI